MGQRCDREIVEALRGGWDAVVGEAAQVDQDVTRQERRVDGHECQLSAGPGDDAVADHGVPHSMWCSQV
jgi:hypothetical protein